MKFRGLRTAAIEPFPKRLRESWHAADFPYSSLVVRVRVYNSRKNQNILTIVMIFRNCTFYLLIFFLFPWQHQATDKILVPQPGMEPTPSAGKVQSLQHWATGEVLRPHFYSLVAFSCLKSLILLVSLKFLIGSFCFLSQYLEVNI